MWDVVVTSALAVAGTLGGSWLTTRQQGRLQARVRYEQRIEDRRTQAITDLAELQSVLAQHRMRMTLLEHAYLSKADQATIEALRDSSHETRKAITALQVRVKLALPELAEQVDAAVRAVYDIGQSLRTDYFPELEERRQAARDASDLVTAAAAKLLLA